MMEVSHPGEKGMVPPRREKDRERVEETSAQAALPPQAAPIALHIRLENLEQSAEETKAVLMDTKDALKETKEAVLLSHKRMKRLLRQSFEKCATSRPCAVPAKPVETAGRAPSSLPALSTIDWASFSAVMLKALAGATVAGAMVGGFFYGVSGKSEPLQLKAPNAHAEPAKVPGQP